MWFLQRYVYRACLVNREHSDLKSRQFNWLEFIVDFCDLADAVDEDDDNGGERQSLLLLLLLLWLFEMKRVLLLLSRSSLMVAVVLFASWSLYFSSCWLNFRLTEFTVEEEDEFDERRTRFTFGISQDSLEIVGDFTDNGWLQLDVRVVFEVEFLRKVLLTLLKLLLLIVNAEDVRLEDVPDDDSACVEMVEIFDVADAEVLNIWLLTPFVDALLAPGKVQIIASFGAANSSAIDL